MDCCTHGSANPRKFENELGQSGLCEVIDIMHYAFAAKPEVPEGGDIFMNRECECCMVLKLYIFLIRFLEFIVDRKLLLHLSQNELF